MPPSFNLTTEPFIPCLIRGGVAEYGLRDVLLKAHDIDEVRDASPLVTVALHRLLLAVLHRVYGGPRTNAERITIRSAGTFDPGRIGSYFDQWGDRFDLFDVKLPFYQRPGFATKEPSGINRLAQELSRGNNAALFDHTTDDPPPALTPAAAARVVIAAQAYAVGGGKSDTGNTTHAPLVSAAAVLARGDSLFETLWLNLTLLNPGEGQPVVGDESDSPVWERPPAPPHQEPAVPRGYLDYLTWQSRTLRLQPEVEADGRVVVRRVSYAQGRKLEMKQGFFDPMAAYSRDEEAGFRPVRLTEHRDLWRDSPALFQFAETDQFRGPDTLRTLASLVTRKQLPSSARYRMSVLGLCTDKAKVSFWRHESLPLPLKYLDDPGRVGRLKEGLAAAEAVAREALRPAVWAAVANRLTGDSGMKPDTDRVRGVVESFAPERPYWSRLELPFRHLLVDLATEGADPDALLGGWFWVVLHRAAVAAFDQSVGRIDAGRDLKAVTAGRGLLLGRLANLGKPYPKPARPKEGAA